jgi:hypothetical protein
MKRFPSSNALSAVFCLALATESTGCAAVESIFKAGMWVGVLAVMLMVALVAVSTGMFRR